jgi:hypothetical protein
MIRSRPSLLQRLAYRFSSIPRQPKVVDRLVLLAGTLSRLGWARSVQESSPVDSEGQPLPWYSYPAIAWLCAVLRAEDSVFEYGAGNSSLWYSARVARVNGVEHDPDWARRLRAASPPNLSVRQVSCRGDELEAPDRDEYVDEIASVGGLFDVIAIDGLARVACARRAIDFLNVDGLIVVDNSDRPSLWPALAMFADRGFARVDFLGFAPGSANVSCTSVLWRSGETSRLRLASPPPLLGSGILDYPASVRLR